MALTTLCFIALLSGCLANEDVRRSLGAGHYGPDELHVAKRAMLQSAGISNLADAFASQIGTQNRVASAKAVSGSSLIAPWYIPKPIQISQDRKTIDSCLGYTAFGKRETLSAWAKREAVKTANRDFVFILDTSGSILGSEFTLAKEAISSLIEAFCPVKFGSKITDMGTKQMAMVLFGSRVTQVIGFEESHKGISYIQDKILSVKHRREGMTSTATALNFVKEAILGKGASRLNNKDVATDVIIITDGRCNMECDTLAKESDSIRAMGQGVNVFAVGVADARECELDIMSGKSPQSSFGLDGMKYFKQMAESVMAKAQASPNKCV